MNVRGSGSQSFEQPSIRVVEVDNVTDRRSIVQPAKAKTIMQARWPPLPELDSLWSNQPATPEIRHRNFVTELGVKARVALFEH